MAARKNEVVKKEDDQNVVALYEGETDTGFEGTTSDDYAIPFVKLLQKMSPEVDESDGSYVDGAKPGMFYNTATGEVHDSIEAIPCHYRRAMVEWNHRDEGGGFVAQHEVGAEEGMERDESGRYVTGRGSYLADTRYFFCINPDSGEPFVLSFASTQIKKARAWLTRMQALKATGKDGRRFTLPMFANVYKITSSDEENAKGKFKGWKIELVGPITDPDLAQAAKDAREMFRNSSDNVKPPETTAPTSSGPRDDEDIPF